MSAADSSDSSDGEPQEAEPEAHYAPPPSTSSFQKKPTPPPSPKAREPPPSPGAPPTTPPKTTPPVLSSPLVYQTPQGVMYATPSNGGVIFSLAPQVDPNSGAAASHFITIPLSMVAANGQGELDLSSKRK